METTSRRHYIDSDKASIVTSFRRWVFGASWTWLNMPQVITTWLARRMYSVNCLIACAWICKHCKEVLARFECARNYYWKFLTVDYSCICSFVLYRFSCGFRMERSINVGFGLHYRSFNQNYIDEISTRDKGKGIMMVTLLIGGLQLIPGTNYCKDSQRRTGAPFRRRGVLLRHVSKQGGLHLSF